MVITRTTGHTHTTVYGSIPDADHGHKLLDALARSYQRTSPAWALHHTADALTVIPANTDHPISTYRIEEDNDQ